MKMEWFTVDKAGLAKLIEKKGKAFAVFELIQNAWDTDATNVTIRLEAIPGRPYAKLYVKDDHPDGFKDLAHAFTLFAESEKKGDPSKRGRFNLGEKLVLALCEKAEIMSTRGSVYFSETGRRESKEKLAVGSSFFGHIRMTRDELAEVERAIGTLLPPEEIETTFNGRLLPISMVLKSFEAMLPTDVADGEGYLRKLVRKTRVTVHQVAVGENAMLYEMGIPVVELSGGERWHVNVHQKVPLNVDRDNVTPAYLQTIRVLLANEMREQLTKDDTDQIWINAATEDERVAPEAVEKVLDERFGKKRAIFDPSDLEANKQLMNEGYTVIPGGSLSRDQWKNVRASGLAAPSGQIQPSGVQYHPDGDPERIIDPEKYTEGQRRMVQYTIELARRLIGIDLQVKIVNEAITLPHGAWYSKGLLAFNLGRLGKRWFEEPIGEAHNELVLHELAHDKVSDHLTKAFADEVGRLGMKLVRLALHEPNFFLFNGYNPQPPNY
jgi:hypothetical protein